VQIDLSVESDFFARALLLEEFKPVMQRYKRRKEIDKILAESPRR